jgi:hypothetical protein
MTMLPTGSLQNGCIDHGPKRYRGRRKSYHRESNVYDAAERPRAHLIAQYCMFVHEQSVPPAHLRR